VKGGIRSFQADISSGPLSRMASDSTHHKQHRSPCEKKRHMRNWDEDSTAI